MQSYGSVPVCGPCFVNALEHSYMDGLSVVCDAHSPLVAFATLTDTLDA